MFSQVTHDIQFEDNAQASKEKRKSMLKDFANEDIGHELLKELKNSINDNNDNTVAPSPTNATSIRTNSFDDNNSLHSVKYDTYSEISNDLEEEQVIKNEAVNIKMHSSYVESLFNSQENMDDNDFKEEKRVVIVEATLTDVKNRELMHKELENVLELRITETVDPEIVDEQEQVVEEKEELVVKAEIIVEVEESAKEEQVVMEPPVEEAAKEEKKEEDDASTVTSATGSSQSVTNTDEAAQTPKKKRVYKPRKKKGEEVL
jgi:hypothetical protein